MARLRGARLAPKPEEAHDHIHTASAAAGHGGEIPLHACHDVRQPTRRCPAGSHSYTSQDVYFEVCLYRICANGRAIFRARGARAASAPGRNKALYVNMRRKAWRSCFGCSARPGSRKSLGS